MIGSITPTNLEFETHLNFWTPPALKVPLYHPGEACYTRGYILEVGFHDTENGGLTGE